MKKVKISISVNSIYFSFTNQFDKENINQTSYIETGNLTFEHAYLKNNIKIISALLKDITNQTKINTVKIKNLELVPIVLKIVKNNSYIKNIHILDNKSVDTNAFLTIVDNKNIEYLNCYTMPGIMFKYLNERKDILIELRNEINFTSQFMMDNKLNKYSTIFYKKSILISNELSKKDIEDLESFLLINNNLQVINLKKYSLTNINILTILLTKYKKENIKIKIYQDENNLENIFNDIEELKKLKKNKLNIKIIYNKSYIQNNFFKQFNLSMLKFSFLAIFTSLIIVFGITKFISHKEDNQTNEIVNEINEIINDTDVESVNALPEEPLEYVNNDDTEYSIPSAYQTKYEKVFAKLKEINKDTIGWLTVKNTDVDYPVVQSTDNDYYLKHSFDNKKNSRGWIYADYRNNFTNLSDNTIIYGHNLKSGYMFGTLQKVLAPKWYNNIDNRKIIFNTEQGNYTWQIFSIYTTEKNNDYLVATFASETNFNNYIAASKEKSIIDFGIDVKYGDNILTLSTCYKDSDHRLIIQAKLIN